MKKNIIISLASIALLAFMMPACTPNAPSEDALFVTEERAIDMVAEEGGKIYNLNDFCDKFMTEKGNFASANAPYRTRSVYFDGTDTLYFFAIDTIPTDGPGIYIRGRITTDDYGGNFYKTLVIQQIVNNDQQNLRISVDMGSASGLFHRGQEILIRCNGLAIGRYANQPQLCVPAYNNNIWASSANQKVGWAPGRIPAPRFREAYTLIGKPDPSKLVYDVMDLATLDANYLQNFKDIKGVRKADGRLVRVTGVHFNGKCDDQGEKDCVRYTIKPDGTEEGNPETETKAWVFGPTTGNVGYPQSRYVTNDDASAKVLVSCSEYAKYAYYYLPAAKYVGSVTGVLGYYIDQPPSSNYPLSVAKWSVTPCDMGDILPECQKLGAVPQWVPEEWQKGIPQPADE